GRLDVAIDLSMPRKQFDECARSMCGGEPAPGCTDFLVKLCDGRYSLPAKTGLIPIAPTPESWPESSKKIQVAYDFDEAVVHKGTSLVAGSALAEKDAGQASAIAAFWKEYSAAFLRGDADKCRELAQRAEQAGPPGVARLMNEVVSQERQRLLWA